jgi:hypothetical protein
MNKRSPKLTEAFTYNDYKVMFDLDSSMLNRKILEFPGGFSSFHATAHEQSETVVSLDPLYDLDQAMLSNVIQQQSHLWQTHIHDTQENPEAHAIAKEKYARFEHACHLFLKDYLSSIGQQRYLPWETDKKLPFEDHSFQLALCSHWLFKQSFSLQQTIDFIDEMCRVAGEVRIFPLLTEKFESPHYLGHLMANFQARGYQISCVAIDFEKNEKGSAMLSIISPHCKL